MAQQGIGAPVFRPASLPAGERNSHRQSPHAAAGNRNAGLRTGIAPRRGAKLPSPVPAWRSWDRSAGLQTGIAPHRGAKLPSPVPACRSWERGWRNATHASPRCFAIPGWARFFGEYGGGSFAACGRDAGLKTGAPGSETPIASPRMPQLGTRMAQRHPCVPTVFRHPRSGPVLRRAWQREFRRGTIPGVGRDLRGSGSGSFAACGRDAGLKTGAPSAASAPTLPPHPAANSGRAGSRGISRTGSASIRESRAYPSSPG